MKSRMVFLSLSSDAALTDAALPDGLCFVSGSDNNAACIFEHGLAFVPKPDYVAARKAALDEVIRRATSERTALERRLAML